MDFPASPPVHYTDEPSRGWPRAAIVTAAIAGLELVALLVIALAFIAKPFADDAASKARSSSKNDGQAPAVLAPRTQTPVIVLNGNGLAGAAGAAAKQVRKLEYRVSGIGDASRRDFERTLVMYRDGAKPEALRLTRDLDLPAARAVPLDGIRPKDLHGAKLALVLGRRG